VGNFPRLLKKEMIFSRGHIFIGAEIWQSGKFRLSLDQNALACTL